MPRMTSQQKYYQNNRDEIRKKDKEYRSRPEVKARRRLYDQKRQKTHPRLGRTIFRQIRLDVLTKLGNRCSNPNCRWINDDGTFGCTDTRCLQVDHVNGGGSKEYRELGMWKTYKKALADNTGAYQALCANCNWIKKHVNQENKKVDTFAVINSQGE